MSVLSCAVKPTTLMTSHLCSCIKNFYMELKKPTTDIGNQLYIGLMTF